MPKRRLLSIASLVVLIVLATIALGIHLGYWRTVHCTHASDSQLTGCPEGKPPPGEGSDFPLH